MLKKRANTHKINKYINIIIIVFIIIIRLFFCSLFLFHFTSVTSAPLLSTRKSYEFEDLLQSSSEGCRVDWYAQSRLGLTRTLSEENVYEDIIGKATASYT